MLRIDLCGGAAAHTGKWIGDNWDKRNDREPASSRCKVEMHAGYTSADKVAPTESYWCVWWVRGICSKPFDSLEPSQL